jgi:malate dehydrogenase (quinone)
MSTTSIPIEKNYDLICVGAGIMSATLAVMAKLFDPSMKILILERLDEVALESSAAWNNAGTGHSALCELNYCPTNDKGEVSINKAISICNQFEVSKQFWSYLVSQDLIEAPEDFIKHVPHHSFVYGEDNVNYLKKRFDVMKRHFMFDTIEYTDRLEKMKEWFPLIASGRTTEEKIAASRIDRGTEVNYGNLTRQLFAILEQEYDTKVQCYHEVLDIDPDKNVEWSVIAKDLETHQKKYYDAHHVFIGAGGRSLLLLQKVEIDEKEGYGGFPVSGEWLVCKNEAVIKQHNAKVYSKAGPNDPPMSTPHLDTRYIDGKRELVFGPFAGFSPKFLKEGSNLDLFKSIKKDNILPMLDAFWHNLPLTKYLVGQLTMTHEDRMDELRKFYKDAQSNDWELLVAGQRVQIIKKNDYEQGELQFGTEVVSSSDGSITCLLGASPGASTATHVMMSVLDKAFPELLGSKKGKELLKEIVPAWNTDVDEQAFRQQLETSKRLLKLD